ncbi:MAG: hypothetical protein IT189_02815 [Microbacteriaceae bacterium]|nr:hypothetical protein [Microbacteriaceae bacterium]
MRRLIPLALLALTLTGCTQLAAIAPVGGARVSEVRYAALDLLVRDDVDVLVAPVCEMADDREVTCSGTTLNGGTIEVVSSASDQANLTVTVDGSVLYSGSIQDVLESALEPSS